MNVITLDYSYDEVLQGTAARKMAAVIAAHTSHQVTDSDVEQYRRERQERRERIREERRQGRETRSGKAGPSRDDDGSDDENDEDDDEHFRTYLNTSWRQLR